MPGLLPAPRPGERLADWPGLECCQPMPRHARDPGHPGAVRTPTRADLAAGATVGPGTSLWPTSHGRSMLHGEKGVNFDLFSSAEHGSSVKTDVTYRIYAVLTGYIGQSPGGGLSFGWGCWGGDWLAGAGRLVRRRLGIGRLGPGRLPTRRGRRRAGMRRRRRAPG